MFKVYHLVGGVREKGGGYPVGKRKRGGSLWVYGWPILGWWWFVVT